MTVITILLTAGNSEAAFRNFEALRTPINIGERKLGTVKAMALFEIACDKHEYLVDFKVGCMIKDLFI